MSDQNHNAPEKTAPFSQEAEEAVLGALLTNPSLYFNVASFLTGDDFFLLRHQWVWQAIERISTRNEDYDYLTVAQELSDIGRLDQVGGQAYLLRLVNNTPSSAMAEVYGRLVQRAATRRRLLVAAEQIKALALDEELSIERVTDEAEARLFSVTENQGRKDLVPMKDAITEYFGRIEHLMTNQDQALGLPTGFRSLDALLGGLQKSDLLIFAGRPGMGKTSFMLSVALNAARYDKRIAIFTMEMGTEQIVQRLVSMETGINMQRLRLGQIDNNEWTRLVEVVGRLSSLKIFIDDTPAMSPLQMRTKCRRMSREHGIDLIIVDYLQLMNAGNLYENNRVQEISYISRHMKELARELNVPLFSAAQLSRAVEQRGDKRPQLSDLRESGCLAGESPVYLPDSGRYVPIADLCGRSGFRVMSLNPDTWKLEPAVVSNAFCTGVKPVYRMTTQLGRSIRATGNHKFLTLHGWKRLDELAPSDYIALPRKLDSAAEQNMSDQELALLGHLIGDGCTLPTHALQYTTRETDLAQIVHDLALKVLGDEVRPRIHQEPGRGWYQVFLPPTYQLTHRLHNPVRIWLEKMGVFGLRSHEKRVPNKVFAQPDAGIAVFLRHLWATDGSITLRKMKNKTYPHVYYASSSSQLSSDVQSLLLRLGINARLTRIPQNSKGRDQYHVVVSGKPDLQRFCEIIQAVGVYKLRSLSQVKTYLAEHPANTNRDIIPKDIWRMYVIPAMQVIGMSNREMQAALGNAYCGTGLYKQNLSRDRAGRLAQVVQSQAIDHLADSHVYWDTIRAIEPDGETEVYDLTVPGNSNFVCADIVAHNSIEQDSDVVMFLYRDEVYNDATETPNQAEIIVAKHRNGPTDTISLYFDKTITRFLDARAQSIDLSRG